MPLISRIRPQPGDVVEIATPVGLAYAQFTHRHPTHGALLRVLPGLFDRRPDDFAPIVLAPTRFLVFFPLAAAANRKLVTLVATELIPENSRAFPTFRTALRHPDGSIRTWWLWDGNREWRKDRLSSRERQLPLKPGVWNDTLLIERIAADWAPTEDNSIVRVPPPSSGMKALMTNLGRKLGQK